ncbi:nucleoside deaminase [Carboxylicivirga sp. A043]|uniref:nucleoside deaminase n=1 Tax=Carboxylicivirga litoralis TaxID=2816963 RepID=UPI0021CB3E60|nr:nucleoside deaminase [Carboxylicivirga sp. A043]MCU4157091.1 nucleoside deaminase [Carboxylicivirga sp. A043]
MESENKHKEFMKEAIRLSCENIKTGGGPFGAVVVRNNEIIARGVNRVTRDNDPTAHAEVNAIREAAKALNSFNLSGCVIYSSCEPCPMCLAAIYWARISRIYYGNTKQDAARINFDDAFFYDELMSQPQDRNVIATPLLSEEAQKAFVMWMDYDDRTIY